MRKVKLYNKTGEFLADVNIKNEGTADAIQWGNMYFFWCNLKNQFREANVYPAIIKKSKK